MNGTNSRAVKHRFYVESSLGSLPIDEQNAKCQGCHESLSNGRIYVHKKNGEKSYVHPIHKDCAEVWAKSHNLIPCPTCEQQILSSWKRDSALSRTLAQDGASTETIVERLIEPFGQSLRTKKLIQHYKEVADISAQILKRDAYESALWGGVIGGLLGQYLSSAIGGQECLLASSIISVAGVLHPVAPVTTSVLSLTSMLVLPKSAEVIVVASAFCGLSVTLALQYSKRIATIAIGAGIIGTALSFVLSSAV